MPVEVKNNALGGIFTLLVIGAGVYGIYLIDFGFLQNQISDYALFCANPDYDNHRCPGTWERGPHITYTVTKDQQLVIRQVEGSAPVRLSECAVVDRTNWKCNYEAFKDYSMSVGFADGKAFVNDIKDTDTYYMKHVSRYEWIATKEAKPK